MCDSEKHGIGVFKENGQFVKFYGKEQGEGPNQFNNPTGLCLDEDTELLHFADSGNHRIQIFK